MSTVSELFRRTQTLIDDALDNINMVDWFNQCQDNILDLLYLPTMVVLTKDTATSKFLVPSNCNGELKILVPNTVECYNIYDEQLYFTGEEDTETITVSYNKMPTIITNNPAQIPDIKSQFHDIYVFYASMMAMSADEEPEKYALYEKDFFRVRAQIQKYYGKMRIKPTNWTVVR